MKTESKLKFIVILYLLLFLCAICISLHLTIYGAQSVQEIQDSHLASVNNEYDNSGDGNNNVSIHKVFNNISSRYKSISKSIILFDVVGLFSTIILFIQISESYFNEQNYLSKIHKRSLIEQKIRLNN
jgi:hypothetical protein